ncbi:DNA repair protein RAD52 homolog isoform X3 [Plodia interpunctella]|uniref:DNA repair protein RAD52 homolog isoform X3 n=1 Tax=Plodia interpunctella TaxID=58824 RepID=UPI002367DAD4|nr:DNA repair protein RAD52 homolog isoform X3 [Plodia interpunctella]
MQRKSGFPVANCSIKMPDSIVTPVESPPPLEEETEQRRQQLINFGHSQWGFNNWNWAVTKQELDFVDAAGNGKYTAGVVAFVSVTVKSFDIQRENIGYATSLSNNKGMAIYKSRKCAVTNALRETLLSFGGSVATELMELLDTQKVDAPSVPNPIPNTTEPENNQNLPNKPVPVEPKNSVVKNIRKEENTTPANCVRPPAIKNAAAVSGPPPVAKAHPIPAPAPAGRVPAPRAAAPPPPRPNSNGSELSEEEARAERKRRQRQAQEEFRLKQLAKKADNDDKELNKAGSSINKLLMDISTQGIVIEESGVEDGKRKSPADGGAPKRRTSVLNRLDIVAD